MRIWERMRKKLCALLTVVLLLTMAAGQALAVSYPFTGVVTDDTNMRSSANSYTANIIRRIPKGDTVQVTGVSGNFYRIEYDGKTGYVFQQYVEESRATSGSGSTLTATGYPYQTVTTTSVNLRKTASTSAKKLATIPRGAKITVHALSGAWANVTYGGDTGWVMKEYIQVAAIVKPTATPAPTAQPSANAGYQLLQSGSRGDHVTALQEALIELGFLNGKADGVYGNATAQAVMAFQRKNSYPVTGTADQNLQALIFSGTPLNSSGKKVSVNTLPAIDGLTVRSGHKGVLVRTIQSMLLDKGYSVTVTGTYDAKTVSAMKAFQQKNSLKVDGICGPETQKLLFGNGLPASATATPKPTATPTALPEFEKPRSTVRYGSKGSDAKLVQQRLIELGYLSGKADGTFGSQSVAALKAFQRNNNLLDDGVAGSGTNAVLFSYLALAADEKPNVLPTPTPLPDSGDITRDNVVVIKQGVTGSAVLRLQQRLQLLGYYTSSLDSKCELDDVVAIRLFQRKNGLSEDGVAGYDTQVLLYSDNAIMYNGNLAGSLTMSYETLKKGMTGEAVKRLQNRLIELNYLSGTADGIYGTSTAEAVYYFQKQNGLVRDSIAGETTLLKLFSVSAIPNQVASATPAPTTPPATITTALMRLGDENESVRAMQQTLIHLGYLTGTPDGVFGTLTYRALKEFQRDNALYADGVAGSQTIAALNNASKTPVPTSAPGGGNSSYLAMARSVRYEYWYATVRNEARKYPYATLFDPQSGISWQVHMFSFGKHAEIEPLTANDTAKMNQVCGKEDWTPMPVWVIFADGSIRIATTHSVPHGVQHRTDNSFPGHACLHFPRTMAQVTAIGPYATKHQNAVDKAWAELQAMLK
ncbi:MAG: peptidoglycan-binding protein [Clostridiales bacterium]|nr:peptidoglycan-binding protein [Clostridiales bacterium]